MPPRRTFPSHRSRPSYCVRVQPAASPHACFALAPAAVNASLLPILHPVAAGRRCCLTRRAMRTSAIDARLILILHAVGASLKRQTSGT
eukprot:550708-Rhodomonas_salina.1